MLESLSDHVWHNGSTCFTAERVAGQPKLFDHRAALYMTPTESLPNEVIGAGELDVRLPIPTPDYLEVREVRGYSTPRLWVDLLQRATGKIRWSFLKPARVILSRSDPERLRPAHLAIGTKPLLDALKVGTYGRSDGQYLYYFGAIWDDDPSSIDVEWQQEIVADRCLSCMRIQVIALRKDDTAEQADATAGASRRLGSSGKRPRLDATLVAP